MPSTQKVHLDAALTNISVGYSNEQFIADQIFTGIPVGKQSDRYYVYGKERFRVNEDRRAPGTEANEIQWSLSDDSYFCDGHALRHPIPDEEKSNADDVFQLEVDATELVSEGVLLNKEVAAATICTTTTNFGTYKTLQASAGGTYQWSDYTNSNPITDIQTGKKTIHEATGIRANTLIISEPVFQALTLHPKLMDIIKYVQKGIVTLDLMALAFGVDKIIVGSALYSSTVSATGADTLGYIWGKNAVLLYVPQRPGKKVPAYGYSFMWNKDGQGAVQVRNWYEQGRRASIIEAERWYDQKVVCKYAGYLFKSAVA